MTLPVADAPSEPSPPTGSVFTDDHVLPNSDCSRSLCASAPPLPPLRAERMSGVSGTPMPPPPPPPPPPSSASDSNGRNGAATSPRSSAAQSRGANATLSRTLGVCTYAPNHGWSRTARTAREPLGWRESASGGPSRSSGSFRISATT